MKKIILFIVCALGLLSSAKVKAQTATFKTQADTVTQTVSTTATIVNGISNITANTLNIKFRVIASSFTSDWYTDTALGICNNAGCIENIGDQLWNGTSGGADSSLYYANSSHDSLDDFHLQLNLTTASTGSHYITIMLTDISNGVIGAYSKTITFIINKYPTAVQSVNNTESDVVLYPNPTAGNEINLLYSPNADVKNISVYNVIGKIMAVYKVSDNNSANLQLENMPSGFYFVRLFNSHGEVVATRKFTKQ